MDTLLKQNTQTAISQGLAALQTNPLKSRSLADWVLATCPDNKDALELKGWSYLQTKDYDQAISIFESLVESEPASSIALGNLAKVYGSAGLRELSIEYFKMAISYDKYVIYHNDLALQYQAIGDYDSAIQTLKEAIEIADLPMLQVNLAGMYYDRRMIDESIEIYEEILKFNHPTPQTRYHYSRPLFAKQKWKEAFENFEYRLDYLPEYDYYRRNYPQHRSLRYYSQFDGRVLVWGDQGYGDNIMFARFLPEIKKKAHIMLQCRKELIPLFQKANLADEYIEPECGPPEYDWHVPLMSLPALLHCDSICGKPYLAPVVCEKDDNFRVGIVWAGNAEMSDDNERSIPKKLFHRLRYIEGVQLKSFQKDGDDSGWYENLGKELNDFSETADRLKEIDLLVCCDTAVGHLAGAMGVPVWNLVRYGPDWRWPYESGPTVWYDSMQVFRQSSPYDWDEVFDRVCAALEKKVKE